MNPEAQPQSRRSLHIAMVAYTRYRTDARVRRDAEALASRGDQVEILCLRSESQRRETIAGVDVREAGLRRYRGGSALLYLIAYAAFAIHAAIRLVGIHLRHRIDVVHVHNLPDFMVLAALPVKLLGVRVILDIHDTMPETYAGKFGLPMDHMLIRVLGIQERVCAAMANLVIVPQELQREAMAGRGTARSGIAVVMNSPDERLFPPVEAREGRRATGDALHLIYHGTIARRHGVDLLVRAVADLTQELPGIRLTACGEGDHLEEVRALAIALGVAGAVELPGMLPLESMRGLLQGAAAEVIPLRADPATRLQLSVKALEAVACGVPVLCAENPTLRHHFGDEEIRYFEPDSVEGLCDAIRELSRLPAEASARAARAGVRLERFAWRHQKEVYRDLIDALAAGPGAGRIHDLQGARS